MTWLEVLKQSLAKTLFAWSTDSSSLSSLKLESVSKLCSSFTFLILGHTQRGRCKIKFKEENFLNKKYESRRFFQLQDKLLFCWEELLSTQTSFWETLLIAKDNVLWYTIVILHGGQVMFWASAGRKILSECLIFTPYEFCTVDFVWLYLCSATSCGQIWSFSMSRTDLPLVVGPCQGQLASALNLFRYIYLHQWTWVRNYEYCAAIIAKSKYFKYFNDVKC